MPNRVAIPQPVISWRTHRLASDPAGGNCISPGAAALAPVLCGLLIVLPIVTGMIACPSVLCVVAVASGGIAMCLTDLARNRYPSPVEQFSHFGTYQWLALLTGILLLAQQWASLAECGLQKCEPMITWLNLTCGSLLTLSGCLLRWQAIATLRHRFVSRPAFLQCQTNASDTSVQMFAQNEPPLVSNGVYRFVRHPSETGLILCVVGVGVSVQAWGTVAIFAICQTMLSCWRIRIEEAALRRSAPVQFDHYAAATGTLIPKLRSIPGRGRPRCSLANR